MKLLTRRGVRVEEKGSTYMADNDSGAVEARSLMPLQATACTYRIAFGPPAGQKVLTVQDVMPKDADFNQHLCSDIDGFSLHAAVRCGAVVRQALERLSCYVTRPALVSERVKVNVAGQVMLTLKIERVDASHNSRGVRCVGADGALDHPAAGGQVPVAAGPHDARFFASNWLCAADPALGRVCR